MFYEIKDNFVTFKIKAQPQSSKNEICGLYGEDALKVKIAAAAVEGAANKELIKFFSKRFKVAKSDVEFLSGETSKIKKVRLPFSDEVKNFLKEFEGAR